jgi:hypothetical protein
MSIWKFVEKMKTKPPKTAREFMGFPVELEWKEVSPCQDDRIMADGRPAYCWWNEIQMLRAQAPSLEEKQRRLWKEFQVLRIAKWVFMQDAITGEVLIRIKRLPLEMAKDLSRELTEHPENFCSIEKPNADSAK